PLRSAARRCSGVHIGRSSKENQAPDNEAHPIHQTQELPGAGLRSGIFKNHRTSPAAAQKIDAHTSCRPRVSPRLRLRLRRAKKKATKKKDASTSGATALSHAPTKNFCLANHSGIHAVLSRSE